jgi:glutaminase
MARREIKADVNELQAAVDDIVGRMGVIERFGKAADHIEGLADIETSHFGIAVSTAEGKVVTGGEAEQPFPIQSISKVFALTLALREFGDKVWDRVGREPSGDPFNSVVDLERHKGIPRNPFINPGAIVVVDMLMDIAKKSDTPKTVKEFLSGEIGEDVDVDRAIYDKETSSGFNNRAMANMCKAFDNLNHEVEAVMKPYVAQCALSLSCRQLALAGRYLMDGGDDPDEHVRARTI